MEGDFLPELISIRIETVCFFKYDLSPSTPPPLLLLPFLILCVYVLLRIESRVMHRLNKHFTTEPLSKTLNEGV